MCVKVRIIFLEITDIVYQASHLCFISMITKNKLKTRELYFWKSQILYIYASHTHTHTISMITKNKHKTNETRERTNETND